MKKEEKEEKEEKEDKKRRRRRKSRMGLGAYGGESPIIRGEAPPKAIPRI